MNVAVHRSLWLLLMAGCLPALTVAQSLDDALRRCAKQSDEAQRLGCFDAVVSTLPQFEADRIGMTADIGHKRDPAAPRTKDETLSARISGLRQTPRGEFVFSLDNGQVWVQAEPSPGIHFAVDEDVRIEHGAMSSLWLLADGHRKVRVKRLQ
jgi:hypothetical protein